MPQLKSREEYRSWLNGKPRVWSRLLATRSALRVLPLVTLASDDLNSIPEDKRARLLLPVFRTGMILWVGARYPRVATLSEYLGANTSALMALDSATSGAGALVSANYFACKANLEISVKDAASNSTSANASAASAYEEVQIWAALSTDATLLESGVRPDQLAGLPLWDASNAVPQKIASFFERLKFQLSVVDDGSWSVWMDWYFARLHGHDLWTETKETLSALLPGHYWWEKPSAINSELIRIRGTVASTDFLSSRNFPAEPELGPGPELEVADRGLSLKLVGPYVRALDEIEQRRLHERIKRVAQTLAEITKRVSNERPALDSVVGEYSELVSCAFEELDIAALWSTGTGLLANAVAFEPAQAMTSSRGPLEPDHFALLKQVAEMHGGFILGFSKGRELTERADQSRISAEKMQSIVLYARGVLRHLRDATTFVDARTRRFLASIDDALIEPGWKMTRAGFAAYAVTRNALIAIGRFLSWANIAFGSGVVGPVVIGAVQPEMQQVTHWVQIVMQNSQMMLAFAEPFPELKIWLAAQIDAAGKDQEVRNN